MYKIINLSILVLIAFLNNPVHAQKTIKLNPNETKVLTNSSPLSLRATCTVQVNNQAKGKIRLSVLKNNCSVNGKNLSSGQATSVTVVDHSSFSVNVDAGAQINLVNLGREELKADCFN